MILLRQIKTDIKQGILLKWFYFLAIFMIALVLTSLFLFHNNNLLNQGKLTGGISLGDVFYYLFRGMEEYNPARKIPFTIADSFLIWNLLLAFMIGHYPVSELKYTGKNYLVRANTRAQWWFSKCMWNMLTVFMFYACIFAGMLMGTFLLSLSTTHITCSSLAFNPELYKRIFLTELQDGMQNYILQQIFVLPVTAAFAISMLEMTVSFITNAPVGYMLVVIICGFSAYYMRWFLPGNSMMVYRYQAVNAHGIGMGLPVLANLFIIASSGIVGYFHFRNKDII